MVGTHHMNVNLFDIFLFDRGAGRGAEQSARPTPSAKPSLSLTKNSNHHGGKVLLLSSAGAPRPGRPRRDDYESPPRRLLRRLGVRVRLIRRHRRRRRQWQDIIATHAPLGAWRRSSIVDDAVVA